MKLLPVLVAASGGLLACGRAGSAADSPAPLESVRPALHTAADGDRAEARLAQYTTVAPYGTTTWYGSSGYVYNPTSYYVVPYYYGPAWYSSYYAPTTWYGSSYAPRPSPSAYTHSTYRPYSVSQLPYDYSGGWLPYAYHYRPEGSFYRYYGPASGSGFHLWFGY
jgi:hypothetical protein